MRCHNVRSQNNVNKLRGNSRLHFERHLFTFFQQFDFQRNTANVNILVIFNCMSINYLHLKAQI